MTMAHRPAGFRSLLAGAIVALGMAGCQIRSPETTGSIGAAEPRAERQQVDALAARYAENPNDLATAMRYAQALRAGDQRTQATAVLQQAALRNPRNPAVLGAYGKSLVEVGRFQEAQEVLQNAHTPSQPDWRILSAQGSAADQMGDHARAQGFYEAALKIRPNEPSILSNLGLSYLLARQLDPAETTLRRAAEQPGADARVRANLAMALGLKGRFPEAEAVLRKDMSPAEAEANIASLRALVAQPNRWKAIEAADKAAVKPGKAVEAPPHPRG